MLTTNVYIRIKDINSDKIYKWKAKRALHESFKEE